jgi:uncharacterized protein with GYD domain
MPIYVTLVKLPAEGMKRMPDFEEAHKEIHKIAEQMGIKGIGAYALLGPYDMMFIYEAPDEKVALSSVLSQLARWGGQTETWTAIPMGEFAELTASLKG